MRVEGNALRIQTGDQIYTGKMFDIHQEFITVWGTRARVGGESQGKNFGCETTKHA